MVGYAPAEYYIWTRSNFGRLELVQLYTSFKYSLKWGDVSTWELTMPMSEYHRAYETGGVINTTMLYQYGGIIVYRNNDFIISGPIVSASRQRVGADNMVTLSGSSDTHWLSQRSIWPNRLVPYNEDGDTTGYWGPKPTDFKWYIWDGAWVQEEFETQTPDHTGSIMRELVSNHISSAAWYSDKPGEARQLNLHDYDRRMSWTYGGVTKYLTLAADHHYGPDNTPYNGRFETVLEGCKSLSKTGETPSDEVDFNIYNSSDGELTFDTYDVTDKSSDAIFGTDIGTIKSFDFTETRPELNAAMIGGQGSGKDREFIYTQPSIATSSIATYGLIEGLVEGDSNDKTTALDRLSDARFEVWKMLNDKAYNIEVGIVLENTDAVEFKTDFDVGYLVTIQTEDYSYEDLIREINVSVDPSGGEIIEPVVKNSDAYRASGVPDRVRDARQAAYKLMRLK